MTKPPKTRLRNLTIKSRRGELEKKGTLASQELQKKKNREPGPHVAVLKTESASPALKTVYEEFYSQMSFASAPNFILTQGHSPTVARGTWELVRNVLTRGEIPRWTKEMMFVAISKDRNCRYCTAAHIACCRILGVKSKMLDLLLNDISKLTPKLRDMILFAIQCSRDPQSLTDYHYSGLRKHGLKESEIIEIIGMSALAVYANIMADATAMEPDEIFDSV